MLDANIATVRVDSRRKVTFKIMAFRQLTDAEAMYFIRSFLATAKKYPKPKSTIVIKTIIGHDE